MAFEHGSRKDGDIPYEHCHLTVGFLTPQKPPMGLVKQLKQLCHVDADGRRPNLGLNYVPHGDKVAARIGAYGVLLNYLTTPHKKKQTDDGVLEFIPPPVPVRPCAPPLGHPGTFMHVLTWELLPKLKSDIHKAKQGFEANRLRNKPTRRGLH